MVIYQHRILRWSIRRTKIAVFVLFILFVNIVGFISAFESDLFKSKQHAIEIPSSPMLNQAGNHKFSSSNLATESTKYLTPIQLTVIFFVVIIVIPVAVLVIGLKLWWIQSNYP